MQIIIPDAQEFTRACLMEDGSVVLKETVVGNTEYKVAMRGSCLCQEVDTGHVYVVRPALMPTTKLLYNPASDLIGITAFRSNKPMFVLDEGRFVTYKENTKGWEPISRESYTKEMFVSEIDQAIAKGLCFTFDTVTGVLSGADEVEEHLLSLEPTFGYFKHTYIRIACMYLQMAGETSKLRNTLALAIQKDIPIPGNVIKNFLISAKQ